MAIALPGAVRTSLQILHAHQDLAGGRESPRQPLAETIGRVVGVLRDTKARWALVGAHAVNIFTEPRATVDFDFLVEESKIRKVLRGLEEEFGELEVQDLGPDLRLPDLDVDLIRSSTHPLFREFLKLTRDVEEWKVPIPEALIVLKFLAATSPWRGLTKKTYDIADLRSLLQAVDREELDSAVMRRLAALVYPGAETEFEALIERVERGDPLTI